MKAAVLYETNEPLQIRELEQDPPKSGEVRVKMGAAGLCASDHHFMTGRAEVKLPVVLGHEGSGTVTEVGPGVTRVKPGDRCALSFISHCGYCRPCLTGYPNLCDTNYRTGAALFDGTTRLHEGDADIYQLSKLGVFGETGVIPEQACHPIPRDISMPVAAMIGCCVTTGVGAVINNPTAKAGMTVAVIGCGGVGLNVIQGAQLLNASRIIAIDIYDHKLEFAYKFGATDVVNSREVDLVETVKELVPRGVDMAFDAFGSPATTAAAVKAVRKTGAAVMVGLGAVGETTPIDMVDMLRNQKSLVGAYYGMVSPHETFDKIIVFYLKGKLDIDSLITRSFSLDQINEGYEALVRGEDGRGVIVYN